MLKNIFKKSFEQNSPSILPPKADRILKSVIKEFIRPSKTNAAKSSKQIEMAEAVLHMRMYQQFGRNSKDMMPTASGKLRDLTGSSRPA